LRGAQAATGEWCLVCLAFNLKHFHTLSGAQKAYQPSWAACTSGT
jgi:hypothetical protein